MMASVSLLDVASRSGMLRSMIRTSTSPIAIFCFAILMLAACGPMPKRDRLLTSAPDKRAVAAAAPRGSLKAANCTNETKADAFDRSSLRVLSWNIHKVRHADLPADLAGFAAGHDLILLQEAVLETSMREALEGEGFSWHMADAFAIHGVKRGVLVAARIQPVDGRVLFTREPLFPLSKSAIITRYRLAGHKERLAVANLHGINFSLGLGRFREQLDAVAEELENHDGPMIVGGDFNTWSLHRDEVLHEVTERLGLIAVVPAPDDRRRAFGWHLDHLFVRGFSVKEANSPRVKSSDHNPILVRLAAKRGRGP